MSEPDHFQITADVALEIAHHEAVVRQAYKDSVGVWTWSVGLTSKSGHRVTRYIDNPQPLEHCLAVYVWALRNYADEVEAEFEGFKLAHHEFAAALSFHWNTGKIAWASWARLWKQGRKTQARQAFMNWRSPPEIIPRRRAERNLFFDGVWSNDGTMTEYTRLTRSYRPRWDSAKRIDVRAVLEELLQ